MDRRHLLIAAVAFLGLACFDELGSYEPTSGRGGGEPTDLDEPSATTGSSSQTSTTGGGSAGGPAEDCTNGSDDDADGKVDCEDEDCGGYQCIPAPSDASPISGLALLLPPGSGAPCGPAFPTAGLDGLRLLAAPSPCDGTWDPPSGQTCQALGATYPGAGCAGVGSTTTVGPGCVTAAGAASVAAVASPIGGGCAGSPVASVAPTFEPARTCLASPGGGCGEGFFCARPPAPSDGLVCFDHAGDQTCADPTYPLKVLVYEDQPVDNRTCTGSCSCEPPQGGSCSGAMTARDGSCSGAIVGSLTLGEACEDLAVTTATTGLSLSATVSTSGSCTPNHRTESGALEGAVHTLCCSPGL